VIVCFVYRTSSVHTPSVKKDYC